MVFLGLASNFSARQVFAQLFATGGQRHSLRLRQALAEKYSGTLAQTALYHTGRSALTVALEKVGSESRKVIIPGLTCIAVVRAVRAAGYEPVYADIDPETLQYDWGKLRQMLQNATKSPKTIDKKDDVCYNGSIIVAQNTLGLPLDISELEKIAHEYQLKIVEDLAHSAGRFYSDGREIGTVGQATALSFGKGKALDTSEGGALVLRTPDVELDQPHRRPRLAERLRDRWYPLFGWTIRGLYHLHPKIAKALTALLVKIHWIDRSADASLDTDVRLAHWQAKLADKQLGQLSRQPLRQPFLVHDRAELIKKLAREGFYLQEIWYDTPVAPARYHQEADFPEQACPATMRVAAEIVNLPGWYPPEQLAPARALIEQYLMKEKTS